MELRGQKFWPDKFINLSDDEFLVFDKNDPDDLLWDDKDDMYGFGSLTAIHPMCYGFNDMGFVYEEWYVEFIEKYNGYFSSIGIEEVRFFIEVFYSGDQCNFEVFNISLLERLNQRIRFSLPISVYKLEQVEINQMLIEKGFSKEEIESHW
ncbi:hypothetical protein D3C87_228100 [compost metagenome]